MRVPWFAREFVGFARRLFGLVAGFLDFILRFSSFVRAPATRAASLVIVCLLSLPRRFAGSCVVCAFYCEVSLVVASFPWLFFGRF